MRTSGHRLQVFVAFLTGAIVLEGTVTATPTYPAISIGYSLDSGSIVNVRRGFRVVFRTSSGAFKGVSIVRASGTLSSSVLSIRETSKGSVNIVAGDTFEVRSIVQPGDKLVEANEYFRPDGLVYVDQTGDDAPPTACSGGPFAAFFDSGQNYATVAFKGDESATVAAASSGSVTHNWSAPTATGTTTSTSANPSFTFPAGEHVVEHTVTDATNSQTWSQYTSGVVYPNEYGPDAPYSMAEEDFTLEADEIDGWALGMRMFDRLDLEEVPDGTLVLVFCREYTGGAYQSFRNTWAGRRNILFAGYLATDNTSMSGEDGVKKMTMTALSPLAYYRRVIAYSKVATSASTPDEWGETKTLTVRRIALLIPRFYTWITEAWDVVVHASFSDALYPQLFITERTPIEQMAQITDARNARVVCDRAGRFEISTRLELMDRTTRNSQTTALTLDDDDLLDSDMDRSHIRPLEFYRTRGITAGASGNTEAFAKWPGVAPGFGIEEGVTEKLIPDSIAQNYAWSGLRGAKQNRDYQLSTGELLHAPTITVTLRGSYDIFDPAYAEWVEFATGAYDNLRGVDVSAFRWLVRNVAWEPLRGTARITLTLEAETYGESGVDDTPPPETSTGVDPGTWTPPSLEFPPPTTTLPPTITPTDGLVPGLTRLARILSNGHIRRTTNFERSSSLGGPSWDDNDLSGTLGSAVQQWCYDSRSNSANTTGWVVNATGIYKVNSIWGTPAAALQYTFAASSNYHEIDADYIFEPGLFVAASVRYAASVKVVVSRDGGITWGPEVQVGGAVPAIGLTAPVRVSTDQPGRLWVGSYDGTSGIEHVYRSDNYGVTWTKLTNIYDDDGYCAGMVLTPLDESVMYHGYANYFTPAGPLYLANGVMRATLPDVGMTEISPIVSSVRYGVDKVRGRFTLSVAPNNKDRLLVCGADHPQTPTNRGVFLITNAGSAANAAATTFLTLVTPAAGVKYVRGALVDNVTAYVFGLDGAIGYSADGATVDSRIGNSVDSAEVVGITG